MTLDVMDLNKILTVNSTWVNKFLKPWAKVGAAFVWKLWENQNLKKNLKTEKTKMIEHDGASFFVQ